MLSTRTKTGTKAAALIFHEYLSAQRGKIPDLPEIEHVSDRVVRVLGCNPGAMQLQGTNTYLVGTGSSRILIDTGQGSPMWIENMRKYLGEHEVKISHVLLTHWHTDHTGGIVDLLREFPHLSAHVYKCHPDGSQNGISDGQSFQVDGATIRALFTPGHATDHMSFVLEEEKSLFTGDNVLGHGFTVIEDLNAYLISLHRMIEQECVSGYPGHGAKIVDLALTIKRYIHRENLRVNQVYSALMARTLAMKNSRARRFSFDSRDLVTVLYGNVSDALFQMALEPCMNLCLWKLAEDGKVAFEVDRSGRRWYAQTENRT